MKPVSNLVSIPADFALSKSIKFSTHRQEVFRILKNTSTELPLTCKIRHLNKLSWRMKLSGYDSSFRAKVLQGGIVGYLKAVNRCLKEGVQFHRSKQDIRRSKKKKTRDSWYRGDDPSRIYNIWIGTQQKD